MNFPFQLRNSHVASATVFGLCAALLCTGGPRAEGATKATAHRAARL